MISDVEKIKLIKELVKDWRSDKLNDLSAMIALSILVDPQKPSKKCREWAMNAFFKYKDEQNSESFDNWELELGEIK